MPDTPPAPRRRSTQKAAGARRLRALPAAGRAADDGAGWCLIPAAAVGERGVIWLREPAGSDRSALAELLRQGAYAKPFVVDDGEVRRLHFGLTFAQSEMSLGDPCALTFRYTRKMMGFLLFQPRPRDMVIVGLGGGSLTKFCRRQLPRTRLTTLEIDREVLAFGALFDLPRGSARNRLLRADARDYFAAAGEPVDVVLVDGCDSRGSARELCSEAFYRDLRRRLRPQGVMVANITGTRADTAAHLRQVGRAFDGQLIVISVTGCRNRLAFAFNDPAAWPPDWQQLGRDAEALSQRHGLDLRKVAQRLRRAQARRPPGAGASPAASG